MREEILNWISEFRQNLMKSIKKNPEFSTTPLKRFQMSFYDLFCWHIDATSMQLVFVFFIKSNLQKFALA